MTQLSRVSGGVVAVSGSQAVPFAPIFWEGVEVSAANKRGAFSFDDTYSNPIGVLAFGTSSALRVRVARGGL